MKNKNYWAGRMKALEEVQYQKSVVYYQDMQEQFRRASNNLQMDIEHWYQRLADNNGISYSAAKKFLKKSELEEFKWSVEDYIKKGKDNAVNQRWLKELENASARYHISYLEVMKLQLQQHAELLSTIYEGGVTDFLNQSFRDSYSHLVQELTNGGAVRSSFVRIDTRRIDTLIQHPWARDGANYSDRIWSNKNKLVNNLHTELTQSILRGDDPRRAINNLSKAMEVSRAQAGRLIMTESGAIASAAQRECYKDLGVEQFEIIATLDSHTCDICKVLDGKVFPMKDFEVGVTAPPFHPNCRCCTMPAFDDEPENDIEAQAKYSLDADSNRDYAKRSKEWNITASQRHGSYEELDNYLQQRYNARIDDDVRALHLGQVNQTLAEFERVMDDYPAIRSSFTGINSHNHTGMAAFIPNGELVLSPKYYNKMSSKLLGTGYHEAGHLLELAIIKKLNPLADSDTVYLMYANNNFASEVLDQAYGKIKTKKTLSDLRKEISEYSLKNESETIAEAVSDYYMNGQNASILSRKIMKVLGGMLNVK